MKELLSGNVLVMPVQILFAITLFCSSTLATDLDHDQWKKGQSLSYDELIAAYRELDHRFEQATLLERGGSDVGEPLHLFVISDHKNPEESLGHRQYVNILINNGIHPGEPDGIDACLYLSEQFLQGHKKLPKGINLCIIPVYNIGGMLNRGCCSRANQNGPEEYGFRGNGQNLDLNRDFIKADSKNAKSFYRIFHEVKPDIFIDTHVSNGADYQYTMTLLCTQPDKLGENGTFCRNELLPFLYREMEQTKFPLVPYVHTLGETPESGIIDYLETPRYATGYSALFGVIGLTTETHMWKPYPQRVQSTIDFIEVILNYGEKNANRIKTLNTVFRQPQSHPEYYFFNWQLDTCRHQTIPFLGYEAGYPVSEIDQKQRLKYNRDKPYKKMIPYYDHFVATDSVKIPEFYVVPHAWESVVKLLQMNEVIMDTIHSRQELQLQCTYIIDYQTVKNPYEGHYLHSEVVTSEQIMAVTLYPGDYLIKTDQKNWRFIVETLEPRNADSYFCWGFFDAVLQQKEWFSSYIFEDFALQMLIENPDLKKEMESKISHGEIPDDHFSKLYFLYRHSPYYESSHNRYPVYRSMN